jgi:hypothetical protein
MQLNCGPDAAYLELFEEEDGDLGERTSVLVRPPGAADDADVLDLEFDEDGHLVGIEFPSLRRIRPSLLSRADWSRRT